MARKDQSHDDIYLWWGWGTDTKDRLTKPFSTLVFIISQRISILKVFKTFFKTRFSIIMYYCIAYPQSPSVMDPFGSLSSFSPLLYPLIVVSQSLMSSFFVLWGITFPLFFFWPNPTISMTQGNSWLRGTLSKWHTISSCLLKSESKCLSLCTPHTVESLSPGKI